MGEVANEEGGDRAIWGSDVTEMAIFLAQVGIESTKMTEMIIFYGHFDYFDLMLLNISGIGFSVYPARVIREKKTTFKEGQDATQPSQTSHRDGMCAGDQRGNLKRAERCRID